MWKVGTGARAGSPGGGGTLAKCGANANLAACTRAESHAPTAGQRGPIPEPMRVSWDRRVCVCCGGIGSKLEVPGE